MHCKVCVFICFMRTYDNWRTSNLEHRFENAETDESSAIEIVEC